VDVLLSAGTIYVGVAAVGAAGGDGIWGVDDLDVETGTEGFHVRDYEVVADNVVSWQDLGELSETEGGQDGHDVGCLKY